MGRPKGSKTTPKVNIEKPEVEATEKKANLKKSKSKEEKQLNKSIMPEPEQKVVEQSKDKPGRPKGKRVKQELSTLEATVKATAGTIPVKVPATPRRKIYTENKIPDFIKRCEKCEYSATDANTPWKYVCLYILHEGHSRGCPPENCIKFKPATSKKRTGNDVSFLFDNIGDIYD